MNQKENLQKINLQELSEKIEFLKAFALEKNFESVEVHMNLNVNAKIPEQMFVQKCTLPHSTGKKVTILAFVPENMKKAALAAGADFVADEENIAKIKNNKIFFDACVASPESMKILSPLAKILGPRGLMPNAKLGTLTPQVTEAIQLLKQGQVSLKNDRYGILHVMVGKSNASTQALVENIEFLIDFVQSKKPTAVKGNLIEKISLSTTMGPALSLL